MLDVTDEVVECTGSTELLSLRSRQLAEIALILDRIEQRIDELLDGMRQKDS